MNNPQAPPAPHAPPNYSNYQPDQELQRLRKRVSDLMRMNSLTPETFQQMVFQLFQESERRRQTCLQEAEEHLRKYHALLSQAGAFSAQGSILFAVVNGFATLEERRIQEMADRAKEKEATQAPPPPPPPHETAAPATPTTNGHPAQEAAGASEAKPSGGKRKKA